LVKKALFFSMLRRSVAHDGESAPTQQGLPRCSKIGGGAVRRVTATPAPGAAEQTPSAGSLLGGSLGALRGGSGSGRAMAQAVPSLGWQRAVMAPFERGEGGQDRRRIRAHADSSSNVLQDR
jgi:hypothetical protein